ncbi:MAG: phage holin family protein [Gemmatimonadetes bacterium]|nr:phage holin family protein [Gemmatimonadota bacterium]
MALEQRDSMISRANGRTAAGAGSGREPSIGELFGQLSSDAGRLIQSEVALAKAELRETTSMLVRDASKLAAAAALGLLGALAATAFLIVGLGDLLDNYWASALLVTIVYLAVAGFLAKSAMNEIKRNGVKPEETLATLREDATWAKREAQGLKQDLTSQKSH